MKRFGKRATRLLLGLALWLGATTARAADLYVPSASYPTIQSAINAAASSGDTIHVAGGVYPGGIVWNSKSIALLGAGAGLSVIDGGNATRCLYLWNVPATARIEGFTLQNGAFSIGSGGGMYSYASSLTLTHCTFTGNSAQYGGGMYNYAGSLILTHCTFTGNSGQQSGGGMYNNSCQLTLTHCAFTDNHASQGGGMYNYAGSLTLTHCAFTDNHALQGGGMLNTSLNPVLTNCIFTGNSANYNGGGMYNADSPLALTNCIFTGNNSNYYGGGMYNYASNLALTNCTFTGNSAQYGGGGMYSYASNPALTNCTFTGNSAQYGGGMVNYSGNPPTLTNCILWGDMATISGAEIFNVSVFPTISYSDVQGGLPAGTIDGGGNLNADPLFVNPAGGDLHLQPGSPCLDAGSNAAVTVPPFPDDGNGNATDLDGALRIQGGTVDMGAYEGIPNAPPVARAGDDQSVECQGVNTSVTLDGTHSSDPDGDSLAYEWKDNLGNVAGTTATLNLNLPHGSHTFTLTVTDPDGASDADTVIVNVVDTTAPVLGPAAATPNALWPPNHQMVTVQVSYSVSDACDPAPERWLSVTSNEPDNGLGDGDTAGDIEIVDAHTVRLRAERSGTGSGRLYTIVVHSRDASGNVAQTRTVTVTVPKSQKK